MQEVRERRGEEVRRDEETITEFIVASEMCLRWSEICGR